MTAVGVPPKASVVIPARNAGSTIAAQLGALATQLDAPPFEVIVVDNASTDSTAHEAHRWVQRIPSLRIVPCAEIGIDRARNAGVRSASADRILICDADDVVGAQWVAAMTDALERIDLVGGTLDTTSLNDEFLRSTRDVAPPGELPSPYWGRPYAVGANIGFRREVFDRVGGFDPEMQGAEELDFCWRAQLAGCSIAAVPDAVVGYRFRRGLRAAMRQSFASGRGCAHVRAVHIGLGGLPAQSRRQQLSLTKKHLVGLARVGRLGGRTSRRRYAQDLAWFAGSVQGLVRYGAMV